jgi:LmbE family N-acetylglucosaminyl deacetylase
VPTAIAIAAHPDDIEFVMAGTLLLLRDAGWVIHYINLSSGNLGSTMLTAGQAAEKRLREARAAAKVLGARFHPPLRNDLAIFYEESLLRQVCAVIREVEPTVILTHALSDYMEDHMTTARVAVTAGFARGIPEYRSRPLRPPVATPCALYHALPHGQCTPTREPVEPEFFIDTTSTQETKLAALSCHASQAEWLDKSQGQSSYLKTMEAFSTALGKRAKCTHAEGWTRHLHYGFGPEGFDPLHETLGKKWLANKKAAPRVA